MEIVKRLVQMKIYIKQLGLKTKLFCCVGEEVKLKLLVMSAQYRNAKLR